jgi:ornithine--oxo-acid transaminase
MVILAEALQRRAGARESAVLMTDRIYRSVYDSLGRSVIHTSTFRENALPMRVGLALDVLVSEGLGPRAMALGESAAACGRSCWAKRW